MGLPFSKSRSSSDSKDNKTEILSQAVTTPKGKGNIIQLDPDLDPRSPTENIIRTPIQVSNGPVLDTPTAIYTPKRIILAEDPRSPTTEYHRTPIVVGLTKKSPTLKIHNKNLDKALKGYSTISPNQNIKSDTTTPSKQSGTIVPPKLLETSPVRLVKIDAHKRRSCVGLLETNIDFTETDIDEVIMKKYHSPSIKKASSESKIYNRLDALLIEDCIDPRSPTTDFKRTPIQVVKKLKGINANIADCASSEEENDNKIVDNKLENVPKNVDNEDKEDCDVILQETELPLKNEICNKLVNVDPSPLKNSDISEHSEIEFHVPETLNVDIVSEVNDDAMDLKSEPFKTSPKVSPEKPPRRIQKLIAVKPNDIAILLENEPDETAGVLNVANKIEESEEDLVTDKENGHNDINNINDSSSPSDLNVFIDGKNSDDLTIKSIEEAVIITKQSCTLFEANKALHYNGENDVPVTPKHSKTLDASNEVLIPNNKINITADVRDFDKKLTNLIYEDSDVSVVLPIIKNKDSNRTPLGERNMNSQAKKASKLKVSDRPRYTGAKPEVKGISKIPTLQSKIVHNRMVDSEKPKIKNNKKIMVQCENTPPRNIPGYNGRKSNMGKPQKPQWDNDATLII